MEDKRNILIVLNSIEKSELETIHQNIQYLANDNVQVHLMYVKPRLPTCYFHIPSMIDLVEQCDTQARETLTEAGNLLGVPPEHQWVANGRIKMECMKLAKRLNTSFILASAAEHSKLSHQFGFRRMSKGCTFKAIQGMNSLTFQAAH